MPTFTAVQLSTHAARLFEAAGTPPDIAHLVAESLVLSDLMGHPSHGVRRVPRYIELIREGRTVPDARPRLVRETAVTGVVDGRSGFGQLAARYAATVACDKAAAEGLAAVGLYNSSHVGRLGEWVTLAAERGLIGLAFCNGGPRGGQVAPFGGAGRVFATNPLAAAVPLPDQPPLVVDFATSMSAEGKLAVARDRGVPVPEGTILDGGGNPTTDPADYFNGGMLLPAGGHKGSGLALLVDVLGGIVTGVGCPSCDQFTPLNGVFFLVLDPACMRARDEVDRDLASLVRAIKATPPAAGFDEVLLPGEPEQRNRARQAEAGVMVDEPAWRSLKGAAEELEVSL